MKIIIMLEKDGQVINKREYDRISPVDYDKTTKFLYERVRKDLWFIHHIIDDNNGDKFLVYDTEKIPRFGKYIQTIQFTGNKQQAMQRAADLLMNRKRNGVIDQSTES